jgi:hypothetical protein
LRCNAAKIELTILKLFETQDIMVCNLCFTYLGRTVDHGSGGCEFGASTLCRRCHHRGHLTRDCTAKASCEIPTTLEELIPADIRLKYGINTHTTYDAKYDLEDIVPDINKIMIPEDASYAELGRILEMYKIKVTDKITKETTAARLEALREWAISHGYRIVMTAGAVP